MAIRGIDTQIMMNRLTDNVKEASDLIKRPEVIQDILGNQSKINTAQEQTKVIKLSESEMEQIRTDVDEGSSGEREAGEDRDDDKEAQEDKAAPELYVPVERHIIDIKI